ncbi:DUF1707 domain-containing protein [Corynebacterium sp. HMSC29G08]|uniref:DUF1707 SHOCT-like domain-containing protein n=1 Tax=Corynebacterium sp. HMSC29G08 TaxID=1581069 RepID=UPI0008D55E24|nr:DUF1707 domain-containing protein [Corynebacterium sp. HMSC29G08]OFT81902.1 hypothetical protein HMPREF3101_09055 [Corynebacterium sp. HMSC29G08]
MSTPYGNMRIGDAERMHAMDTLGRALGEGRLTMDEFDQRCNQVASAQTNNDLRPILADLPSAPPSTQPASGLQPVEFGGQGADKLYSAREIVVARRQGQKTRAGVFCLGTLGTIAGSIVAQAMTLTLLSSLLMFVIPTLFVLLYVMKVGPDHWYQPTIRELEKQRRRVVRARQLELEQSHAYELAQRKLERKAQIDRLTGDALNVAQQTMNRFKPRD